MEPIPERTFLGKVFLSPDENRLRAGWRLAFQTVLMLSIAIVVTVGMFIGHFDPTSTAASTLVETLMITLSILLSCRWVDRRPLSSLGLKLTSRMGRDLLLGLLISFVVMGILFFCEYALGWLTIDSAAWQTIPLTTLALGLLSDLVFFVFVGWNEELLSRGYHLHTLAGGLNLFWGVVISSCVFAALHLENPNSANKLMVALGIFAAALFLAFGFLRTGQLWLSIGLHIGWNFFEGPVFSFPVSGTSSFQLLHTTVHGPVGWTGGAFGPEAGLIVFPILALGAVLIYYATRGREGYTPGR